VVGDAHVKEVDFYTDESGLYSSALRGQEEEIGRLYKEGWGLELKGLKKVAVPAATLNAILEKHLPAGTPIDFISVDVEGTEVDVLRGLDIEAYAPRVFVMETNTEEARGAIAEHLGRHGYTEARQLGVNTFFVRSAEDAAAIAGIAVAYEGERSIHPLGERYTLAQCLDGGPRSEREYYLKQIKDQAERTQALKETLNGHIRKQIAKLNELHGTVRDIEADKKRLEAELLAGGRRIKSLEEELKAMDEKIRGIESSLCWRATRPLREAKDKIDRLKKGLSQKG
jgi:FkbM family methyltransferase